MTIRELFHLFERSRRRFVFVGYEAGGVAIGLDLEGRLFTALDGQVLNRVNPEAFAGTCTRLGYLNPGGDGLWPAPEGSRFGYEYATGAWRVPPGLSGARWWVAEEAPDRATVRAEIDFINAAGVGVPLACERRIAVARTPGAVTLTVTECFEYLGAKPLTRARARLAPWSLCQFDCGPGCEVVFPAAPGEPVRDLYDPSHDARTLAADGLWHTRTEGGRARYQIALGPAVDWIEFRDPRRGLRVHRTTQPLAKGLQPLDIADLPPTADPAADGVRFSVYSDPSAFMEIEAVGGSPRRWLPGTRSEVTVVTTYRQ